MSLTTENVLLIGSILLFISILAGKTSYRFGVPTLLFFLAVGMLAGSEGLGRIHFNDPALAQFIGIVALNFILFSGGLDTNWQSIKPVLWQGVTLSTVGVLLTAALVGVFTWWVTDFSLFEGLLLGSIVSSTDAAAVFSILRSRSLSLKSNLRPMLELESGSNDPMAYILTITFIGLVQFPDTSFASVIPVFFKQLILGGLMGAGLAIAFKTLINRIKLDFEGLYPVLLIACMFFTFSATNFIGGNGFLAVYLLGVYLGNQDIIHKKSILRSFDGYGWLMQIVLFLTLGLLVFPSQIVPVIGIGLLISGFLIVVARPISVFICLMFFRMYNRSRWFMSWVGLRGAVPIVFATYPLIAGVEKAHIIFNIVFFISLSSVLIQGTTLPRIAKWLHVSLPDKLRPRTTTEIELSDSIKSELVEVVIPPDSPAAGKQIVELGLPKSTLIMMVVRDEKYITPHGFTKILPYDKLLIISEDKEGVELVHERLDTGPELS